MATHEYNVEYNRKYCANKENRLKAVWRSMLYRCNNKKSQMYKNYGGRGIMVCDEWNDFGVFKNDMISGYKQGLSIDRVDINSNYCKDNCRWATSLEQAQNTTRTRLFTLNGMSMTLTSWAKKLNKNRSTLSQRYYVYHWPIEKTLLT